MAKAKRNKASSIDASPTTQTIDGDAVQVVTSAPAVADSTPVTDTPPVADSSQDKPVPAGHYRLNGVDHPIPGAVQAEDTPPGLATETTPTPEADKAKADEALKEAARIQKRKDRRIAKLKAQGKVPRAEAPKAPNGRILPKQDGARAFCFRLQVANSFPDHRKLAALMADNAKGTKFENKSKRWFTRRAYLNVRLYTPGQTAEQVAAISNTPEAVAAE